MKRVHAFCVAFLMGASASGAVTGSSAGNASGTASLSSVDSGAGTGSANTSATTAGTGTDNSGIFRNASPTADSMNRGDASPRVLPARRLDSQNTAPRVPAPAGLPAGGAGDTSGIDTGAGTVNTDVPVAPAGVNDRGAVPNGTDGAVLNGTSGSRR